MQKVIVWVLLILAAITLQSTIIPYFSLAGIVPNLVIAAIMVLALWYGRLAGIWAGFLTGLLLDIWSPEKLGLQALALTITGAVVGFFDSGRINSGPITQFFLFVLGSSLHDLVVILFDTGFTSATLPLLYGEVVPRALFTAVFGMLLVFSGHQVNPYGRR